MHLGGISGKNDNSYEISEKNLSKSAEESGYNNAANFANRENNRDNSNSLRSNQRPSTAQSQISSSSSLAQLNKKSDHIDTFGMKRPYSAFEVSQILHMIMMLIYFLFAIFRIQLNFQTPTKESTPRSLCTSAERGILTTQPVVTRQLSTRKLQLQRVDCLQLHRRPRASACRGHLLQRYDYSVWQCLFNCNGII